MTETIFSKVLVLRNGLSHGHLSISFPNTFLCLLQEIEQKLISLNANFDWCQHSRVIKDLSNSGRFFSYLVSLLSLTLFILFTRKFHVSLKNILTKKSIKQERLQESPLRNFINAIRDVTCNEVLITLVTFMIITIMIRD